VHGKRAAKRAHGLEAVLVDQNLMQLSGLAPGDDRCIEVAVAGVAALLVAKVIKIRDRVANERRPDRQKDKDAGDVLRLVLSTPVATMAESTVVDSTESGIVGGESGINQPASSERH